MKQKLTSAMAAVCCVLLIVFAFFAVRSFFIAPTGEFMTSEGIGCFRYYTIDSNVLCAVTCACALPFLTARALGKQTKLPRWLSLLRLCGTAAVTVTLLTVVFFLGPKLGYKAMFSDASLWLHGIDPLLSILSFCFLEGYDDITRKDVWAGMLTVFVYGFIYLFEVVIVPHWEDFYGFNAGGHWYISMICMLAAGYVISRGLIALQRKTDLNKR